MSGWSGPVADAAAAFTLGGDLTVNRMGFGAMRLTGRGTWGPPRDPDSCLRILRRAVELGVNLIDTADSYGPGVSEELIAQALHPYPEGLVIATKGGFLRDGPNRWRADGRPEHLREACEGSLRRLRLQRIDVYQHHIPDRRVPIEESVGALAQLQAEGKIRHIGVSNVSVEQLARARSVATIVSVQDRFNHSDRGSQAVLAACERDGLGFLPWAPLDRGALTEEGGPFDRIAKRLGATAGQVALAWLLHRSPVMLPIPGTSSMDHLEENIAAASLSLDREALANLDGNR
jgi:pyridoxine 4-dehydrogenase